MSGNVKFDKWVNDDNSENYKCRAWVNFEGRGTVTIRASGGVASITDNGTGDYTVNFATAMVDANYQVSMSAVAYSFTNLSVVSFIKGNSTTETSAFLKSVSQLSVVYGAPGNSVKYDCAEMNVAIFR